eukprot:TRINITY_DN2114_c0_g1_i5.p1 TRINITY_DN2114_c0_g1~~TRINITY_DN2114_c0_g1_i5.p1  ORF type:complete len:484 (+),score=190.47 TRINITY_DN2114_c0_g1_i5:79-1530(+)
MTRLGNICLGLLLATGHSTGQQACNGMDCQAVEQPLQLGIQKCSKAGGCQKDGETYITMDANWRWLQHEDTYTNCWDQYKMWVNPDCSSAADQQKCAQNCMLEGVDYGKYGVTSDGTSMTMKFKGPDGNIGSRLYMLEQKAEAKARGASKADPSSWEYKTFNLLNKEFSFTVEAPKLSCGINGPIYFVEMNKDGDMDGTYNSAGPLYGTGYCDAQCPGDMHFVKGRANIPIQNAQGGGADSAWHACCNEIDLWEANNVSTAVTPHPCEANGTDVTGTYACPNGADKCRETCDHAGCDFASYRLQYYSGGMNGAKVNFYGNGLKVDASKPVTVVTQFVTDDGTDTGKLKEMRRVYVQDGKVIQNMNATVAGNTHDSITDGFCKDQANTFDDKVQHFAAKGGMAKMGDSFTRGMVLVFSLWDDKEAHMLWLDGKYPQNASDSTPGAVRGTCGPNEGPPMQPEQNYADVTTSYGNLKYGEIGSTFP